MRANMIWKKRKRKISKITAVSGKMMKACGMKKRRTPGARRNHRLIASDLVIYLNNDYNL
jgi:hypothetical protein